MNNNLKNILFSFEGRINRKQYWSYVIPLIIILFLLPAIIFGVESKEAGTITLIGSLLTLWPSLAVQVKRWHDRNKSGWWVLIAIIPIIGIWALIENGFLKGDEEENFYGQPPA